MVINAEGGIVTLGQCQNIDPKTVKCDATLNPKK
jgi:hypothetical protein